MGMRGRIVSAKEACLRIHDNGIPCSCFRRLNEIPIAVQSARSSATGPLAEGEGPRHEKLHSADGSYPLGRNNVRCYDSLRPAPQCPVQLRSRHRRKSADMATRWLSLGSSDVALLDVQV